MNNLLSKKTKESFKPPLALGILTNAVVGSLGFRAELDIVPEGDHIEIWE